MYFSVGDISRLHQLHLSVAQTDVEMNYVLLLDEKTEEFRHECNRIMADLVKVKLYNEARLFAGICKVTTEDITTFQVKNSKFGQMFCRNMFFFHIYQQSKAGTVNARILPPIR